MGTKRPTSEGALLPEEVLRLPRLPLFAALENVRSAFNVGSIFRTSDAVRLGGLVLAGYTARPPSEKLAKTALGAELAVPWEGASDGLEAIRLLRARGLRILAVERTDRSRSLYDADLAGPLGLVFGNEIDGVGEACLAECDGELEIPMAGLKNSINVATAYGIVVYEIWRRRGIAREVEGGRITV